MFEKFFLVEFNDVFRFRANVVEIDGDDKKFKVQSRDGRHEEFDVKFNIVTQVSSCGCQLFEFLGMPCKHLLIVFQHLFLDEIPPHFIMKRWTKDATRVEVVGSKGLPIHNCHLGIDAMRIRQISRFSAQLAHLAGSSEEATTIVMDCLREAFLKVKELDMIALQQESGDKTSAEAAQNVNVELLLKDPNVSQTKGRRSDKEKETALDVGVKTGQVRSGIEVAKALKKTCKVCKGHGHNKRTCPEKKKNAGAYANDLDCDEGEKDSTL